MLRPEVDAGSHSPSLFYLIEAGSVNHTQRSRTWLVLFKLACTRMPFLTLPRVSRTGMQAPFPSPVLMAFHKLLSPATKGMAAV